MRLLVTGAGGFLGANLVEHALSRSLDLQPAEIHVLSRSGVVPGRWATSVTAHSVDLTDRSATAATVEAIGATHLCHLAWLGPEHGDRYRSTANETWIDISRDLFEAFASSGGQRLVHLGSCIEYGNEVEGPRSETLPLLADTAYGRAKAEVARLLTDEFSKVVSSAVARVFFAYGPYEQTQRLVPSIIGSLNRHEPVELTEGNQKRDFLDARDVASALWALLNSDAPGPFNVGSGQSVPVRQVAQTIGELIGRPELLRFGARPDGADSAADITANIDRITSATGWAPTVSIEDGLAHAIEWWSTRGHAHTSQVGRSGT